MEPLVKAAFCKECGNWILCAAASTEYSQAVINSQSDFDELEQDGHHVVTMPLEQWKELTWTEVSLDTEEIVEAPLTYCSGEHLDNSSLQWLKL